MDGLRVEELEAGTYIVRYATVLSNRFDSTAFKKVMGIAKFLGNYYGSDKGAIGQMFSKGIEAIRTAIENWERFVLE